MTLRRPLPLVLVLALLLPACGGAARTEAPLEPVVPTPSATPKPWAKRIGGSGETWGWDASLGPDGQVVVTGGTTGTATFEEGAPEEQVLEVGTYCDAFLAAYGPEGALRWLRTLRGDRYAIASKAATDDAGNVVLVGYFERSLVLASEAGEEAVLTGPGEENPFLLRFDPDGRLLQARVLPTEGWAEALGLAVLPDGSFVVSGAYGGRLTLAADEPQETVLEAPYDGSAFVAAYDAEGSLRWSRVVLAEAGTYVWPWALAAHGEAGVFLAGEFVDAAAFESGDGDACELACGDGSTRDGFAACYSWEGALRWARPLHATGWVFASCVDVTADGCYRLGGSFAGTLRLGTEENPTELDSYGEADGFMAGWQADGTLGCAVQLGGARSDEIVAIRSLPDHSAYVLCSFRDAAIVVRDGEIEAGLRSAGLRDVVLFRCDAENCVEEARCIGGTGTEHGYGLDLDADGRLVVTGSFEGSLAMQADPPLLLDGAESADAFVGLLRCGPSEP